MAHEGTIHGAIFGLEVLEGKHLVKDAWEFLASLGALNLGFPEDTLEVVFNPVEDANNDDALRGVLKVGEPPNHLLSEKAIRGTSVLLALRGHGAGVVLAVIQTEAGGHGDGVDVDYRVLAEVWIAQRFHGPVVSLLAVRTILIRRVRPPYD